MGMQKVKNTTKAEIIQEIPNYHFCYYIGRSPFYGNAETLDDPFVLDKVQLWEKKDDGTISDSCTIPGNIHFYGSEKRLIGVDYSGLVCFDSANLLPKGYPAKGVPTVLPDGGIIWKGTNKAEKSEVLVRCAPDGSEMYTKEWKANLFMIFEVTETEIFVTYIVDEHKILQRLDSVTGEVIEEISDPFGLNVWNREFCNGYYWITHDDAMIKNGKWEKRKHILTKFDETLHPLASLEIPSYTHALYFSPDGKYAYVFMSDNQVMVVNTETMEAEHILSDKSFYIPFDLDASGRFWLQRSSSTMEAWDLLLKKPVSRHKLKGSILGNHKDSDGRMCVVTWSKKENILRIYRIA